MNLRLPPPLLPRVGHALLVLLLAVLPMLPPLFRWVGLDARFWLTNLVMVVVLAAVYWVNYAVAMPRLLFRGHWLRYAGLLLVLILAPVAVGRYVVVRPAGDHGRPPDPRVPQPDRAPHHGSPDNDSLAVMLLCTALTLGASSLMALIGRGQQQQARLHRMEQEKLHVELSYLKAQLSPHVFFNTLNSIYALTEIDVDKARLAIFRLSRIMRHLLYQTQQATVSLDQEVLFLEDYVALMQLRLTPNMTVEFQHSSPLSARHLAPTLFQPFVENAFKHGVSTRHPASIRMQLTEDEGAGTVLFEVRNQVFDTPQSGLNGGSGIGLANTRRRLELLYPGRYELDIVERSPANEFGVRLTLRLG